MHVRQDEQHLHLFSMTPGPLAFIFSKSVLYMTKNTTKNCDKNLALMGGIMSANEHPSVYETPICSI